MKYLYKYLLKPVLFMFDPEHVHIMFTWFGQFLGATAFGRWLVSCFYGYRGPDISKEVDGVRYKTPLVLAAGFDYNGHLTEILPSVGFGGVEVGSISLNPWKGNDSPRLRRCVKSRSIIVNKGLKNQGMDAVLMRLKQRKHLGVQGVSVVPDPSGMNGSVECQIDSCVRAFRYLVDCDVADYYTMNISCPNVSGGESFGTPEFLERLMDAFAAQVKFKGPLYIKMPLFEWNAFRQLCDVLVGYDFVKGVIVGNLQKNYDVLAYRHEAPQDYRGGLSGEPCRKVSLDLIRNIRALYADRFTIIGCGGTMSVQDAMDKMDAGADLIHMITGMIFEGPHLMKDICHAYADRVAKGDFK